MTTRKFCDICEKEIFSKLVLPIIEYGAPINYAGQPRKRLDLCGDCYDRFLDFIKNEKRKTKV